MLLASFEKILNRSLPRSLRAQALAVALAGKSMAVEMTGVGPVLVSSTGERIRLTRDTGAAADASVSAGPFTLLALAAGQSRTPLQGGATIRGNSDVAQQFSELLGLLRPDPEEELAQLVGDAPAHHLGRLVRGVLAFGERAARYLGEQCRRVPGP